VSGSSDLPSHEVELVLFGQFRVNGVGTREKAFVMRVDGYDEDDLEDEDDGTSAGKSRALMAKGARFSCNDLQSR
jgi:nucleoporin GLE1